MSSGDIDPRSKFDSLLDLQTQRLEDIANNAVDFIKINLLILGAFAPFIASVLGDSVDTTEILNSEYVLYGTLSWVISTFLSTTVYRFARGESTSQFEILEQAITSNWDATDLRDEIIDNSADYERKVKNLMRVLAIGVGFSLVAVLFLALAVTESVFTLPHSFKTLSYILVLAFGILVGFGIEFWTLANRARIYAQDTELNVSRKGLSQYIPHIGFTQSEQGSVSSEEIDPIEFAVNEEGLSRIRARLLDHILANFGLDTWTISELEESLEESKVDIGLTQRMIARLEVGDYVREVDRDGPSTYIMHERQNEILNGSDIEKEVERELDSLINHIEESTEVRDVVTNELGIGEEDFTEYIENAGTGEQISILNTAIDAIRDHLDIDPVENRGYGKIEFRTAAREFQITPKGVRPIASVGIKRAVQTIDEGGITEAMILADQSIETFLRSLVGTDRPRNKEFENVRFDEMLQYVHQNGLLNSEQVNTLEQFRDVRNQAVHRDESEIDQEYGKNVIERVEKIVEDHQYMT